MAALREVFAIFGVQFDTTALKKGASAVAAQSTALKSLSKDVSKATKAEKEAAKAAAKLEKEAKKAAKALKKELAEAAKAAEARIKPLKDKLLELGVMLGAGFVVQQVGSFINSTVQAGVELGRLGQRIGISTDDLQRWQHAAEASGASAACCQR